MIATPIFKEIQKFRQWWLWLLLVYVAGDVLWITFKTLRANETFTLESTGTPLLLLLIPIIAMLFILSAKLETEITGAGIYVRFFPIHRRFRFYPWSIIDQAYVRTYKPLLEYGGWGLRGLGSKRAINVSGNKGLQLVLQNGDRLLIGTRRMQEVEAVLTSIDKLTPVNTSL